MEMMTKQVQNQHTLQLSVNYISVCTKSIYIQSVFKEYSLDLIGARPIYYNRTLEIS